MVSVLILVTSVAVVLVSIARINYVCEVDEDKIAVRNVLGTEIVIEWKRVDSPLRVSGTVHLLAVRILERVKTPRKKARKSRIAYLPRRMKGSLLQSVPSQIQVIDISYPQ